MRRVALAALLSHWRRAPLQLAIVLIGLALATGLWTGVQAINAEAKASYSSAADRLSEGQFARLENPGGLIAPKDFVALRRAGWLVSPVVDRDAILDGTPYRLLGVDPFTSPGGAAPLPLGEATSLGDFLEGRVVFAAPDTAFARAGLRVETLDSAPPGTLIMDIALAWQLTGQRGFEHLVLHPQQPLGQPPVTTLKLRVVQPGGQADIARLTDSFHLNLTAFGFLSFGVGLFIVQAAVGLAFEQRRAMIRTLRALGAPLRDLILLLAIETLLLALIAGALGIALGYGIAVALLPDVAATLRGLYGAEVSGGLTLRPAWIVGGMTVAVAGAMAAAAQSLWQMARMPLLAPARPRAWAMASLRRLQGLAGLGAALLAVAAGLTIWGSGLVQGFILLAALLLGAAFVLPLGLVLVLRFGRHLAKGPVAQWVWADTQQQIPGLSLALMALLLALAANVGVGTMVSSFRLTFTGWLDQRLASELYVTARDEAEGAALRAYLAPRVSAVLPIRSTEVALFGQPSEVYGIVDHPTYREAWPLLTAQPDAWDSLAAGQAVLVNEQMFRRHALALGDPLEITPGWSLPIAGVYSDYGNPAGQAITALAPLSARFPDMAGLRHAVRLPPDQAPELARALSQELGLPARNILNQEQVKAFSLDIFERTFVVSGALNVLTLGVAGFAMLASLLTLASLRLPQLAPLWALGLTRKTLARIELLRALLLAALTWLLAVPVGLALAWVLLAVVNVEAFGWRLPMFLFPAQWLWLGLWAALAGVLAASLPALRLSRLAPARLIAVFSNER